MCDRRLHGKGNEGLLHRVGGAPQHEGSAVQETHKDDKSENLTNDLKCPGQGTVFHAEGEAQMRVLGENVVLKHRGQGEGNGSAPGSDM